MVSLETRAGRQAREHAVQRSDLDPSAGAWRPPPRTVEAGFSFAAAAAKNVDPNAAPPTAVAVVPGEVARAGGGAWGAGDEAIAPQVPLCPYYMQVIRVCVVSRWW